MEGLDVVAPVMSWTSLLPAHAEESHVLDLHNKSLRPWHLQGQFLRFSGPGSLQWVPLGHLGLAIRAGRATPTYGQQL
jgi:hypothetical protein